MAAWCLLSGNESILRHYFTNSSLVYESVVIELLDTNEHLFMCAIKITGHMHTCNSYLGISVFDKTSKWRRG